MENKERTENTEDIEFKVYHKGDIIFGEGAYEPCMYEIHYGKVGIFKDYGKKTQLKLSELQFEFFGEMGLVEGAQRSATAVALEETGLFVYSALTMARQLKAEPLKTEGLLNTISRRLQNLDKAYLQACACVDEYLECEKSGKPIPLELIKKMKFYAQQV